MVFKLKAAGELPERTTLALVSFQSAASLSSAFAACMRNSEWAACDQELVKDTLITARKQRRITALAYCCDLTDLLLQPFKNKKPPVNKWFPVLVVRWASPWKTSPDWKPPWSSPASTGLRTISTIYQTYICIYIILQIPKGKRGEKHRFWSDAVKVHYAPQQLKTVYFSCRF